jgi:hypothetical protein
MDDVAAFAENRTKAVGQEKEPSTGALATIPKSAGEPQMSLMWYRSLK